MPLLARHLTLTPAQLYTLSQEALRSVIHDQGLLMAQVALPRLCELAPGDKAWASRLWPDVVLPAIRGRR